MHGITFLTFVASGLLSLLNYPISRIITFYLAISVICYIIGISSIITLSPIVCIASDSFGKRENLYFPKDCDKI